jgi:putative transposase
MTSLTQRQVLLALIEEAVQSGAKRHKACTQIGLSARTEQRWRCASDGAGAQTAAGSAAAASASASASVNCAAGDRRTSVLRAKVTPPNKLSPAECERAMQVLNSEEFKDVPPSQIVPRLADAGLYVASEASLYRLLRRAHQTTHRRLERAPRQVNKPRAMVATQPDQIYCWDITYLPSCVRGMYFYLYLFVDLFSRKIVGWQVFERESAAHASALLQDICERQGISPEQLTVHSDNGGPMKGETMLAAMQRLGVAHSRSRPGVSNDNAYSESLFRTLKYRPQMPVTHFEDLSHARRWVTDLVRWYNHEHRHSKIRFVTPTQRHAGLDAPILKNRCAVYAAARQANPKRWSGPTRNWERIGEVHLNPHTEKPKDSHTFKKTA